MKVDEGGAKDISHVVRQPGNLASGSWLVSLIIFCISFEELRDRDEAKSEFYQPLMYAIRA